MAAILIYRKVLHCLAAVCVRCEQMALNWSNVVSDPGSDPSRLCTPLRHLLPLASAIHMPCSPTIDIALHAWNSLVLHHVRHRSRCQQNQKAVQHIVCKCRRPNLIIDMSLVLCSM